MPMRTKEEQRAYQLRWILRRRQDWIDVNGPCQMCGSSDKLEVDHKDASTKLISPTSLWGMSDKNPKKIAELAKCWVLCSDCHKIKSAKNKDQSVPQPGALNGNSKITEDEVRKIRSEYVPRVMTQKILAEKYGLERSTISLILSKKNWSHI